MDRKYVRIHEIDQSDLISIPNGTFGKGYSCGYASGQDLISYKLGYHTLMYGHPFSGKTQLALEQMIYLSKRYGIKHAVYLPESGREKEIVGELAMVYMHSKMYGGETTVDIDEFIKAISWLDEFFVILSPKDGLLTLKDAYNSVAMMRQEGVNISMLWIDHFGYVAKDSDDRSFGIADYVRDSLQFVLRASLKMDLHTVILAHLRDTDPVLDKESGIWYMPKPMPGQISGGQQNWYNGYQMVGIWRAPEGIVDHETGEYYNSNEMHIIVQKSKPKGVGHKGTFKLFFDEDNQQLYEKVNDHRFNIGEYFDWAEGSKKGKKGDLPF